MCFPTIFSVNVYAVFYPMDPIWLFSIFTCISMRRSVRLFICPSIMLVLEYFFFCIFQPWRVLTVNQLMDTCILRGSLTLNFRKICLCVCVSVCLPVCLSVVRCITHIVAQSGLFFRWDQLKEFPNMQSQKVVEICSWMFVFLSIIKFSSVATFIPTVKSPSTQPLKKFFRSTRTCLSFPRHKEHQEKKV